MDSALIYPAYGPHVIVRPIMNGNVVGCGEERTASFAIDAVPIVTASYGPEK